MTRTLQSSRMSAEMAEQPALLRRFVARTDALRAQVAATVPSPLAGVALVGRGSSANAARIGRTLAELATGRPALLVSPSIARLYAARTDYGRFLAVGLSQSGRTPEVVGSLAALRAAGAATVAVTADVDSPLAHAGGLCLDLDVGTESAVPTTKAFLAQVAVLVVVAEALGAAPLPADAWLQAADAVGAALDDVSPVEEAVDRLTPVGHLSVVASGLLVGVAWEAALKLQETAQVAALAHSAAGFRHGPLALLAAGHPVLAVAGPGPAGAETARLVRDLRALGGPVTVVGPDGDLPVATLPEPLAALPAVVRAQQLALALAVAKGLDPDSPPALSKVTLT